MKKSIPLKEIVGFLPYELNIKTNNLIRKMVIETSDLVYVHQITRDKQVSISNVINGIGHKPIVRPLSDLTKEITHNGETFVPANKLGFTEENLEYFNISYCPYWIAKVLHEWHFDIYDWIKDGLAVDMNTI